MENKIKILTLSDHPLVNTGVGIQTKNIIVALLETGKFEIVSLGGTNKQDIPRNPYYVQEFGKDWKIYPAPNFGTPDVIRNLIVTEKPDMVWFMTDPRYWHWLWNMENEIRSLMPMIYYHVWDNYPYPYQNLKYYSNTDVIVSISKVTHDIVKTVSPETESYYLPHAVDPAIFTKLSEDKVELLSEKIFGSKNSYKDKFIIFWNNKNMDRKQAGSLLFWYNDFLMDLPEDKRKDVCMIMHTKPIDNAGGPDLDWIRRFLKISEDNLKFSATNIPPENLALLYNIADVTINIAYHEGFGLSTLESLSCGTPIIATKTGGLIEQIEEGHRIFGYGLEPAIKSVVGSPKHLQDVPAIFQDRVTKEQVIEALNYFYNLSSEEKLQHSQKAMEFVQKNYSYENYKKQWVDILLKTHEKYGTWNHKVPRQYKNYNFCKIS